RSGVAVHTDVPHWVAPARQIEVEVSIAEKGRLAIELQIGFALQDVVEHAEAAADTGLARTARVPGKAQARPEVLRVGIISSARRARVAGEQQSHRRIDEPSRMCVRR